MILAEFIGAMVTLYGGTPPSIIRPQGWHVFNTSVTFALILNDVSDFIVGMHWVVAPAMISQRFSLPVGE